MARDVPACVLGAAIVGLHVLDAVQQPILARLVRRTTRRAGTSALVAGVVLAAGCVVALDPAPGASVALFASAMAAVAGARGYLAIRLRALDVAPGTGIGRHVGRREAAELAGAACGLAAPVALAVLLGPIDGSAGFAVALGVATMAALVAMRGRWPGWPDAAGGDRSAVPAGRRLAWVGPAIASPDGVAPILLIAALDGRVDAPGASGPLLVAMLAMAAGGAFWSATACGRFRPRRVLAAALAVSAAGLLAAAALGPGDAWAAAALCLALGGAAGVERHAHAAMRARHLRHVARRGSEPLATLARDRVGSRLASALAALVVLAALGGEGLAVGRPDVAVPNWVWAALVAPPLMARGAALFALLRPAPSGGPVG